MSRPVRQTVEHTTGALLERAPGKAAHASACTTYTQFRGESAMTDHASANLAPAADRLLLFVPMYNCAPQ
ncbi:MAG: hypothetical protein ACOCZK_06625, partial [Planctomycetota bacterium]